jgi:serine phosphatase RsbU (regulator of sigma subunit)
MSLWSRLSRRGDWWSSIPAASYAVFLGAVFLMFLPAGLLGDVVSLGAGPSARVAASMMASGGLAVGYVAASRRPRWLLVVVAVHLLVVTRFDRVFAPGTLPLSGAALEARLRTETNIVVVSLSASFVLLSQFVRQEGTRYVRAHTEIALARDIHRLLVPPISRRVGRFEFCGSSVSSGEVGGDLVDLVESDGRWIAYVADVSGHGVGAGLLMGMVKSAARTELRRPQPMERLLGSLDRVLIDLKKPEMFVTFAGIQFDGAAELQFSVAGHLPILHYRRSAAAVDELSLQQVPLAMFGERSFAASRTTCAPGDLFVILTDGLTEVFDRRDREFGLDGVKDLVRAHALEPLRDLQDTLLAAARAHGPQLDDQTLLLIRVLD